MTDPVNPLTLSQLQASGLSRADMAGLFGANMQLNPYMLGAGVVSALPSLQQNIQQNQLLKELQKRGPQDITPQAFREYQAALNNQANNAKIAGYGTALENINRAQSAGLGNVYKTVINPSQALRGALALNQQGIQARNQLDIQGAQAQQARQAAANQAMLQRGQFQEQGRKEYGSAVSALRGAKAQNWNNFIQGLAGAGLNSFVIGSPKTTTPKVDEFPNTNPNNVAVPITGKTPYMENQWFSNNKGPAFNSNAAATPTIMAPQAPNMGAGATPVTSGLLPTPPQEQPSTIPNFLNAPSGTAPKNWVEFAMNRRANMTEQGLTNSPMRPVTTEPTMQAPVAAAPAPAAPVVASAPVAPAAAAPVAPAPASYTGTSWMGPSVENQSKPPAIKNNAYSEPYTETKLGGEKYVYQPDGSAKIVFQDGREISVGYTLDNNGKVGFLTNPPSKTVAPAAATPASEGRDISSPVNAAPAPEVPAAAAPVAPAPVTPAVENAPAPPLNRSKAYSKPLTRLTSEGDKIVYGPDGVATTYSKNGKEYKVGYRVLDNGRIATEDNDSPTDLKSSVPHYNKNDRQSLIKRLFNYGKNTLSPANAAPAPAAAAPVSSNAAPVLQSSFSGTPAKASSIVAPKAGSLPPEGLDYKLGATLEPNQTYSIRPVQVNESTGFFSRPYVKPFKVGSNDAEIAFDTKGRFSYNPSPGAPEVRGTYVSVGDKVMLSLYDEKGKVEKTFPVEDITKEIKSPTVVPTTTTPNAATPVQPKAPFSEPSVDPVTLTPSSTNTTAPAINKNNAYSEPLVRVDFDNNKLFYGTDGVVTGKRKDGTDFKWKYEVLEDGRIAYNKTAFNQK